MDGKSIVDSVAVIIDRVKYRKYAKEGYTTIIYINKENTLIKILDGHISGTLLKIPSLDMEKIVDKVYILPSKKIVTRLCFIKEDINTTLDITITDTSNISSEMFKKFIKIKLLEDLQSFNMGQVLLGGALGFLIGFIMSVGVLLLYTSLL